MSLLFALPSNWRSVPFREIISDSAFGPRFSGESYATDGNVATLRTTDLEEDGRISYETMPLARLEEARFETHFLKCGDLVITRSGTCGIAAVFNGFDLPVLPGAFLIRFRLTPDAEPKFYQYFFNSRIGREHLLSMATGAVQQNLNITNVSKLLVPLPPVAEQRAILGILSAYDDLIENNTRRLKILEDMAQMIYREWFVNFRFPGHEKVKMVDSGVGPLPEGWKATTLGNVLTLEYGKALKDADRRGGPIPVYGSSGVVGHHSEMLTLGPGIIVGRKGNVGRAFFGHSDFWVIDTAYYVRSALPPYFTYFNLCTHNFLNNDAAVPGLNRNQAHSLPVVVPQFELLAAFDLLAAPTFNLKQCLEARNANLRKTRDFLLPKLISGEITVEAANEVAAELIEQPA